MALRWGQRPVHLAAEEGVAWVIYCSITRYLTLHHLIHSNLLYLSVCRSGIQQLPSWAVLAQGLPWGCTHSKAWLGLGGLLPVPLTWLWAGSLSSHHKDLSVVLLVTWQLASCRRRDGRMKEQPCDSWTALYDLISGVTRHHFSCVLLVIQTIPGTVWEGPTRVCIPGGRDHWRRIGSLLAQESFHKSFLSVSVQAHA